MNKLALWVFPLGVVVGGPFLPIAILLYWVANNIWTYGQQHLVFGRIDKEEQQKKEEAIERKAQNAPKPGAKPTAKKKSGAAEPSAADGDKPAAATNGTSASTTSESTTPTSSAKAGSASGKSGSSVSHPGRVIASGPATEVGRIRSDVASGSGYDGRFRLKETTYDC